MKICPNCGAENENHASACILCGYEFEVEYNANGNGYSTGKSPDSNEYKSNTPNYSSGSNGKTIAIAVMSILIIAGGFAGGAFFMKNKSGNNTNSGSDTIIDSEGQNVNNEQKNPTVSENNDTDGNSSEKNDIQDHNNVNDSSQNDQFTENEISSMYSAYIAENPDPNHTYDDPGYGYYLIDLNEDGNQELLITTDEIEAGSPGIVAAYSIRNNKLTQLWITDPRFISSLCEGNIISSYSAMGQGGGTGL